ncbi:hypothetical protein MIZ03_1441 [Rhodoferax lithotrophicus]|uniref:Uncharacterized protein n=1 Tax=Rhodoferax lithotrophicus TaxID=2798804 RepID=A0ABM7MJU7_9BURK|nr:hypothetical protein MIZ03_1441 [Rhodoferax sp. MIZ03]
MSAMMQVNKSIDADSQQQKAASLLVLVVRSSSRFIPREKIIEKSNRTSYCNLSIRLCDVQANSRWIHRTTSNGNRQWSFRRWNEGSAIRSYEH